MEDMISYTETAMERAMNVEEVILRAIARKVTWWQAAEIIGISDRQMPRWHERDEQFGIRGLYDQRRGKPSPKRVAPAEVEKVLQLLVAPLAARSPGLRLALALEIERHCSADEILQGRLIDLVAFVDVDGAPDIPVEAGVE